MGHLDFTNTLDEARIGEWIYTNKPYCSREYIEEGIRQTGGFGR
ncbi:hypothetical protein HanXRQr2_Chr10g0447691 [Helianthus annuus]|uniref:Uncharacterized protein n=1 Tax=Helianthus annuus TaxID=4232 RepID=A0A9K3N4E9_HELAN|nr:hypothetical protein HanXRQr2_Chr10g0447691 [Helianthus annuus]